MTELARPAVSATAATADLLLYTRAGCHLCDEARDIVRALLAERLAAGQPAPTLVERDIETNPEWLRAFGLTIPVLEHDDRRLDLATSPARIRRFLDRAIP